MFWRDGFERATFPVAWSQAEAVAAPAPASAQDEERRRRILEARRATASFGQVVALMSRSEPHRRLPIGEVRWLVAPPARAGQILVAAKRVGAAGIVVPSAALLWARVSDEIDQKLSAATKSVKLEPPVWTSGDNIWLIEAVGDPALIPGMIKRLGQDRWKGRVVKVRSRNPDGTLGVKAIGPL